MSKKDNIYAYTVRKVAIYLYKMEFETKDTKILDKEISEYLIQHMFTKPAQDIVDIVTDEYNE